MEEKKLTRTREIISRFQELNALTNDTIVEINKIIREYSGEDIFNEPTKSDDVETVGDSVLDRLYYETKRMAHNTQSLMSILRALQII